MPPFFVSQYDVINDPVTDAFRESVQDAGEDHALLMQSISA